MSSATAAVSDAVEAAPTVTREELLEAVGICEALLGYAAVELATSRRIESFERSLLDVRDVVLRAARTVVEG